MNVNPLAFNVLRTKTIHPITYSELDNVEKLALLHQLAKHHAINHSYRVCKTPITHTQLLKELQG